jgi:uncharacterized protein (TIGR03437 family)
VAIFGEGLAPAMAVAGAGTLPTQLAGTRVVVTDSYGAARDAGLFFVSPTQVNCLIPAGMAPGTATLAVVSGARTAATGWIRIEPVAPALFTASADGIGVAAAEVLWVKADGRRESGLVFVCSPGGGCTSMPIDLGSDSDRVYVSLYGTGIRAFSSVAARVDGEEVPAAAAAHSVYPGLDQVNIGPLPRDLVGRGEVNVAVTVDGRAANLVTVNIR